MKVGLGFIFIFTFFWIWTSGIFGFVVRELHHGSIVKGFLS